MATLSIPFPDGTKRLVLQGNRITIGRLPDNLIQIRDLTISGRHAELILEGDHYRVHDVQSTNGIFVDGQQVEDFHLHEGCKLRLGTVECEFFAGTEDAAGETAERVPTHIEMRALKQANGELKAQVEALRGQNEKMVEVRNSASAGDVGVSLEKYDQIAAELAALQSSVSEQRTQMEAIRTQLAVVTRERDNLQRAYDEVRGPAETSKNPRAVGHAAFEAANPGGGLPLQPTVPSVGPKAGVSAVPTAVPAGTPRPPQGVPNSPVVPRPTSGQQTLPLNPPIQAAPVAPAPAGLAKPPIAPPRPAVLPAGIRPAATVARSENGQNPTLPKPPGALAGTPARRPPSAIQPQPQKPLAARPAAAGGLKETQKLED